MYKSSMAITHLGNAKWRQKGREEQAEPDGTDDIVNTAALLGVDVDVFIDTYTKSKLKVALSFIYSSIHRHLHQTKIED